MRSYIAIGIVSVALAFGTSYFLVGIVGTSVSKILATFNLQHTR